MGEALIQYPAPQKRKRKKKEDKEKIVQNSLREFSIFFFLSYLPFSLIDPFQFSYHRLSACCMTGSGVSVDKVLALTSRNSQFSGKVESLRKLFQSQAL
jgi:hypothetical protein